MTRRTLLLAAASATVIGCAAPPSAPPTGPMSFFVTSTGLGKGGDLGGLEGADRHCQALAQAAGAGNRTWRAYLSTQGASFPDTNVVHARDRIGSRALVQRQGRADREQRRGTALGEEQHHEGDRADREGVNRSAAAATSRTGTTC